MSYLLYVEQLYVVDRHLAAHVEYLNKQYEAGIFIASGRRIPRTGGVILARAGNRHALQEILKQDPFCVHGVAEYDVIEFSPSHDGAFRRIILKTMNNPA